jgi:glycosyltransferase involved in cell wall biosynthesis
LLNDWQIHFSRRVGLAARRTFRLLTANSTNAKALAPRSRTEAVVMVETGVEPPATVQQRDFHHGGPLRLLWSGVFEHRKALHLLLEALAKLPANVPYELRILGRGPLENRWRKIARRLNVDQHCHWLGWLVHPQAIEQYQWADALVFSSLRDTTGNVVLEAFAAGTPVLCLDHQGMADIVTPQCGVKLPVTTPHDVVLGLRDTLVRWHANPDELARLSRGAVERADHYSWTRQGERMADLYRQMCESKATAADLVRDNRMAGSEDFADAAIGNRRGERRIAEDESAAESLAAGAASIGS